MAENDNNYLQIEKEIVRVLKNIYDPEIPVNIYDLGLIYEIDLQENQHVKILMTLTAPNCPVADHIVDQVKTVVEGVKGIESAEVELTFEPPWDKNMLSEEAKLELGFL